MVINGRRLRNTRIARVVFKALLSIAYFVIYDLNKDPLMPSYHPTSLNKTIHIQRKFSDSIELNIQRGQAIMTEEKQEAEEVTAKQNSLFQSFKAAIEGSQ